MKLYWPDGIVSIALKLLSLLYIFIDLSPEQEHKLFDFSFIRQLHHLWWPFIILTHLNLIFFISFFGLLKSSLSSLSSLSSSSEFGVYE